MTLIAVSGVPVFREREMRRARVSTALLMLLLFCFLHSRAAWAESQEAIQRDAVVSGGLYLGPTFVLSGVCHEWIRSGNVPFPGAVLESEGDQSYRYSSFSP